MAGRSAGVLLFRRTGPELEVLLVHPGGPFWRNKDAGAWQIPKGGVEPGEEPAAAAVREVQEELGLRLTATPEPLCSLRQAGGKRVEAFALEQDLDPAGITSNLFELEWPPRSGRRESFPEVDRASWFTIENARRMILPSQEPLLDSLVLLLTGRDPSDGVAAPRTSRRNSVAQKAAGGNQGGVSKKGGDGGGGTGGSKTGGKGSGGRSGGSKSGGGR